MSLAEGSLKKSDTGTLKVDNNRRPKKPVSKVQGVKPPESCT